MNEDVVYLNDLVGEEITVRIPTGAITGTVYIIGGRIAVVGKSTITEVKEEDDV